MLAFRVGGVTQDDWCAVGDSITTGVGGSGGYPDVLAASQQRLHVVLAAGGGEGSVHLGTHAAAADALTGIPRALSILYGNNDIAGNTYDRTAYLQHFIDFFAARSPDYKKIICTLLPTTRTSDAPGITFMTEVAAVNVIFRSWVGVYVDACCDFAADPVMGAVGAENDTNLYGDGIHPTALGQTYLAADMLATLHGLGIGVPH